MNGAQGTSGRSGSVPLRPEPMRFLFVTLGHVESAFYGAVGAELARRGHRVAHVTYSRRAARILAARGQTAWCLPDLMDALGEIDVDAAAARIEREYGLPTLRDVYRTDFVCDGRPDGWCVERTVRHVLALERVFDEWSPDVLVPEVGNETIRVASHLVAMGRGIPVLLLFYTIFPSPLRLAVDTMDARLVDAEDLVALTEEQTADVRAFVAGFRARRRAIRAPREAAVTAHRMRLLGRHLLVKAIWDRDNPYLRPIRWVVTRTVERLRRRAASLFYRPLPDDRPFVYFPLHVADDYKIKRVIPHLADQGSIVEQLARSLPQGLDLVVKEHPMSIGRTPLSLLRRLARLPNVRVVSPDHNSHDLIEASRGIVAISSTVGLEALLYEKPVLTLGQPFYAGHGITLDAMSTREIPELVSALLRFQPDPERIEMFLSAAMRSCWPGAPVLVDRSEQNALRLASSIEGGARQTLSHRRPVPVPLAAVRRISDHR